jgi:hypothetical protein
METGELARAASKAILERRDALAVEIVTRQYGRQPERWTSYGDIGREKSVRDAQEAVAVAGRLVAGGGA